MISLTPSNIPTGREAERIARTIREQQQEVVRKALAKRDRQLRGDV